jgi:hypothetical protein
MLAGVPVGPQPLTIRLRDGRRFSVNNQPAMERLAEGLPEFEPVAAKIEQATKLGPDEVELRTTREEDVVYATLKAMEDDEDPLPRVLEELMEALQETQIEP